MVASLSPMTAQKSAHEAPKDGLTIDELASKSHVPSRTIRFYQSKGALMAPEIVGRVAYYGEPHLERLKLIAQLQDRGLRIDAIRDLCAGIDKGELDLAEWLGVEQKLQASWVSDQPRTVTEAELYELAGTRRAGLIADLVRTEVLERKGDVFLLQSPSLLQIAMKLEQGGVDIETSASAARMMRKHMSRAAEDLVEFFFKRVQEGDIEPRIAGKAYETLRPMGLEAVRVIFAREMEKVLRKLVESGKMAKLPTRVKKRR